LNTGHKINFKKNKLRSVARIRRKNLALNFGPGIGALIAEVFFNHFVVTAKLNVAGYWPIGSEVDIRPLLNNLHQENCGCFLPVITARDQALSFRKWQPDDRLVASNLGTLEPSVCRPIGQPNMVFVPLLAYDAEGYRIGYGGGFYDRTLSALRSKAKRKNQEFKAIGIGYAGQKVERVPREKFDQRIDWMITEEGVCKF